MYLANYKLLFTVHSSLVIERTMKKNVQNSVKSACTTSLIDVSIIPRFAEERNLSLNNYTLSSS